MGLMDAFNPEATTTIKVGELYRLLEAAATNKVKADFLLNGVKSEVPYRYIREVVTGEKESDEKDPIVISVDHDAITGILENIIAAGQQDEDENFTKEELEEMDYDDLCDLADEMGVYVPRNKTNEELIDEILKIQSEDAEPDFDPLPFPEVCKTKEENDRYHFLAAETKTDLEHIAHELGVAQPSIYTKEKLLDLIIEAERKAAGEDKGGEK
jgi:hypothetical protein